MSRRPCRRKGIGGSPEGANPPEHRSPEQRRQKEQPGPAGGRRPPQRFQQGRPAPGKILLQEVAVSQVEMEPGEPPAHLRLQSTAHFRKPAQGSLQGEKGAPGHLQPIPAQPFRLQAPVHQAPEQRSDRRRPEQSVGELVILGTEEIRIESTGPVDRRPPGHQGRRGNRVSEEHLFRRQFAGETDPLEKTFRSLAGLVRFHHIATDGPHPRFLPEHIQLQSKFVRHPQIVGIQEGDELPAGLLKSPVAGPGRAAPILAKRPEPGFPAGRISRVQSVEPSSITRSSQSSQVWERTLAIASASREARFQVGKMILTAGGIDESSSNRSVAVSVGEHSQDLPIGPEHLDTAAATAAARLGQLPEGHPQGGGEPEPEQ